MKRTNRRSKAGLFSALAGLALGAVVVLGGSTSAQGAVFTTLYSTDFNAPTYSDGGLIGQDGWAITGASVVNPIAVTNTGTNGIVPLTTTGQDVNRTFAALASDSAFLSADFTISAAQATGDYFIHLGDGGSSNFYGRVYAKSSGAGFVMAMTTSSGAPTGYGSTVLNFGQTYHMVARYDFVAGAANDTGALYIDPVDPQGVGDTAYVLAQTIGTDATTISSANLRQGTAANAPTLTVDNLAAVTNAPEPASLGLLAVAGLTLVRRKR